MTATGSVGVGRRERAERAVAQVIGASGVPVADLVAAAAVLSRLASESNLPTVDGASSASDGEGGYAAAGGSEERTSWAVAAQFCDDAGHLGSRLARYLERIGHPVPDAEPR